MRSAVIHPLAKTMAHDCNHLHQAGLSPARSGNVSALDGDLLWITARGLSLREVTPENLVQLWPDGRVIADGDLQPSTELPMHQAIYRARPDIGAIVHTHPPKATALAVARQPLDRPIMSEVLQTLGKVPLVEYRMPGSPELGEAAAKGLQHHNAVLLANHGVVAVGKTLADAVYTLELVENYAEIFILSRQLGAHELTPEQVQALQAIR